MSASEFDLDLGLPPRNGGLTHVIDKGLGPRAVEDLLETAGAYIDIVKLGWGTGFVTPNLGRKLELYREAGKPVVCGGTFFEVVYARDKLDEYRAWLTKHGFTHVEISDGVVDMPRERKLELIAELARDFTVLSEVGSKDADEIFAPYQWVEWITEELAAGAWKVITRGSRGRHGRHLPAERRDAHGARRRDRARRRARRPHLRSPPEVRPGVVREALRPRGEPRQHPAGRGDPARDAPPRPPRRHAEGGAPWRSAARLRRFPSNTRRSCSAEELILAAYERFGDRLCLTCSWQKQSSVLVHMVAELGVKIDIVELDTHLFFRESYETRERLVERYGIELIRPEIPTVAEQHRREGPNLWERDPDRCCHIRKVEPLIRALQPYDAWISGIRRDQSPSRVDTPQMVWSDRYRVWKLHPLARWDEKRVWAYMTANEIPYNPLHDSGYRSIGCIPCTRPIAPGRGRASRPLGGIGQARVRHSSR